MASVGSIRPDMMTRRIIHVLDPRHGSSGAALGTDPVAFPE